MNTATIGLFTGLILALAGICGGFGGFLFALVLGTVGFALGAHRDGSIDLSALLRGRGRG